MAKNIRLRTKNSDGMTSVQAIIRHPMETGFRIDQSSNELVPQHYIKQVIVEHNNHIILSCDWSRAVSKNPYLAFMFKGGNTGDIVKLTWIDNQQNTDSFATTIQ